MRRIAAIHVRVLTLVLAATVVPVALAAPLASTFLLRHGVLVDSNRGVAYVGKVNGGIEAVDLAGGGPLWTFPDAAIPLGADQQLLVAQVEEKPLPSERLRIVILDLANGRKVSAATVPLPAEAHALLTDYKGKSFRATAEREGGVFVVAWVYEENLLRDTPPAPGEPAFVIVAGSARVHRQTGKIVAADGGPVDELPERWRSYGAAPAPPWRAGNVVARTEGGRGRPLTLKRTDAANGRPLPDQVLSAEAITFLPSADQRHLLVSERIGKGGPDDPEYRWSIYSIETGERAAELRNDVSAVRFFVFGDSVICESRPHGYLRGGVRVDVPLEIHAIPLTAGFAKWKVELRDSFDRSRRRSNRERSVQ